MNRFNLRVYGLCVEDGKLLLTDEIRFGMKMTKLPGGGLQFGEGLEEALKREWREELEVDIEVGEIFYVNPFLQTSFFNSKDEVISLYFYVYLLGEPEGRFTETPMDFPTEEDDQQVFRWVPLGLVAEDTFTFPIDKAMVKKLNQLSLKARNM
ncbi:MAG: NUDIX domain-containing protein [Bacteroidota bacterium]